MSRDDGFQRADLDTGWHLDPKVRKLAKVLLDDSQLAVVLMVWEATLLASWREGRRLTASEAESWFEPTAERVGHLQAVGLLDSEARIPDKAWRRWYGPAQKRRAQARAAGLEGNRRRWHPDTPPIATRSQPDRDPIPNRQADRQTDKQTDQPSARSRGDRQRSNGSEDPAKERAEAVALYRELLKDPGTDETAKRVARDGLTQLGEPPEEVRA